MEEQEYKKKTKEGHGKKTQPEDEIVIAMPYMQKYLLGIQQII